MPGQTRPEPTTTLDNIFIYLGQTGTGCFSGERDGYVSGCGGEGTASGTVLKRRRGFGPACMHLLSVRYVLRANAIAPDNKRLLPPSGTVRNVTLHAAKTSPLHLCPSSAHMHSICTMQDIRERKYYCQ
uniref:Uncharacterized protein n=1 Tax=Anopheles maculatus TaxID=74869 RepID=A0A182SAT0_9DIPT